MGMKKALLLTAIVATTGIAYYFLGDTAQAPAPEMAAVAPLPVPQSAPVVPLPAEPLVRYPIEVAAVAVEKPTLPELDNSDSALGTALTKLFGKKTFRAYFYPDKMIRRFVATIDNLPRHEAPAQMMPVKPVGGSFLVKRSETGSTVDPANDRRYLRYLNVMSSADVRQLVDLYIGLYPVFQQAYRELGYPKGYFNDRLIEALDDLLATPELAPPLVLQQPKVLYQFADPALESRSAGQKIMLRLGADNMARAKAVLKAIRTEVLSRSSPK
ncbi:MAG: DUF3014 domain-containing protein [Betaproteobacteria bacterium HGW-Betaproteobacteria-10]|jgi:hypothetical protein|nr:MAG: DUF3014 domain-containing protein [Betaproteobacteria bacterium HGW-Betaproteobacteria-10]